jgi:hypothetical protein
VLPITYKSTSTPPLLHSYTPDASSSSDHSIFSKRTVSLALHDLPSTLTRTANLDYHQQAHWYRLSLTPSSPDAPGRISYASGKGSREINLQPTLKTISNCFSITQGEECEQSYGARNREHGNAHNLPTVRRWPSRMGLLNVQSGSFMGSP